MGDQYTGLGNSSSRSAASCILSKSQMEAISAPIHIHVGRLRNTAEVAIWISISWQAFQIRKLEFKKKPFAVTSFDRYPEPSQPSTVGTSDPTKNTLWTFWTINSAAVCQSRLTAVCARCFVQCGCIESRVVAVYVWVCRVRRGEGLLGGCRVFSIWQYSMNFHLERQEINVKVQLLVLQTWMQLTYNHLAPDLRRNRHTHAPVLARAVVHRLTNTWLHTHPGTCVELTQSCRRASIQISRHLGCWFFRLGTDDKWFLVRVPIQNLN